MFWQQYVALCKAVGKSPNVVANEIGVKSSGTVTGWKNGAMPRAGVLSKLAKYFGVSVQELTGGQKEKPTPISGDGLTALDEEIIDRLLQLEPDEVAKVDAFVQGLLAAREA